MLKCMRGRGRGVNCEWIVGWGRVSDDDGHGFIMSSIPFLQTIHATYVFNTEMFSSLKKENGGDDFISHLTFDFFSKNSISKFLQKKIQNFVILMR
jgi:hypothetical protein